MAFFGLFGKDKKEKLDQGLEKTKTSLFDKISKALVGKTSVDDEFLDELIYAVRKNHNGIRRI